MQEKDVVRQPLLFGRPEVLYELSGVDSAKLSWSDTAVIDLNFIRTWNRA